MKSHKLFAFTLAAALTAVPAFSQQPQDNPGNDAPKQEHGNKPDKADKNKDKHKDKKGGDANAVPKSDKEPGVQNPERQDQPDHKAAGAQDAHPNHDSAQDRNAAKPAGNQKHAEYHFKGDEKSKLRSSYKNIDRVDRSRRVTIVREQVVPVEVRTRIEPVPVEVVSYLPPAPSGYTFGFVDGYCVVYDPTTFIVIDVIDLF